MKKTKLNGIYSRNVKSVVQIILFFLVNVNHNNAQKIAFQESEVNQQGEFIEAIKAKTIGDYQKALQLLNTLKEKDPDNPVIYYELAQNHEYLNQTDDAVKMLTEAIKRDPKNEYFISFKIRLLEKQKRYSELPPLYDQLIAITKDQRLARRRKAIALSISKEYALAIKAWDDYQLQYGQSEEVYRAKYDLHIATKDGQASIEELEKMNAWRPNTLAYMEFLAQAYDQNNKSDKANELYANILKIDPNNTKANIAMASIYKTKGKEESYLQSIGSLLSNSEVDINAKMGEIIPLLKKFVVNGNIELGNALSIAASQIITAHPTDAKSYALAGDIVMNIGDNNGALVFYQKSLSFSKKVWPVWENYFLLLTQYGKYNEMLSSSEEALEYFPMQPLTYFYNGYALLKTGKPDLAISSLEQAILMASKAPILKSEILGLLALCQVELGNLIKSKEYSNESLSINSKSFFGILAEIQLKLIEKSEIGKTKDAFESLLNAEKNMSDWNLTEAFRCLAQGDTQKAHSAFSKVFINPEFKSGFWHEKWGDCLYKIGFHDKALEAWVIAKKCSGKGAMLEAKIKQKKYLE